MLGPGILSIDADPALEIQDYLYVKRQYNRIL